MIELVVAGAADKVNVVATAFPLNVSVRNATEVGIFPM
jgi:hypothetical protein